MALYNTLDEFLLDTNDCSELLPETICENMDIDVCHTDKLPNDYLGLADPIQRVVFINNNVSKPFSNFIIAHELTHAVLGDVPAAYLQSTYTSYLKIENEANHGAITLLIRYYLTTLGIDLENLDITNFLNAFKIPGSYYFMTQDVLEKMA